MRHLELTPRLTMVAALVPEGARLADVGTDHAYLPAALLLEGRISAAIAADLRPGPLNRAKETAHAYGLRQNIEFRLCDGLSGIHPEEVDTVVIAGMGGETISQILQAAPWLRERAVTLILQPMSSMPELRGWLEAHGYRIEEERLAQEGDTIYTALLVRAGKMSPLTPAERWVGLNCPDPLRKRWLEHWEDRIRRALAGMGQARQEAVQPRMDEWESVLTGLQEMKEEWNTWQL